MTKAQAKVYDALVAWFGCHTYAPSLEELAKAVGTGSLSTVHVHVQKLIAAGKVRRTDAFARGLELVVEPDVRCPTCGQRISTVT